jgi:hypothetical protein
MSLSGGAKGKGPLGEPPILMRKGLLSDAEATHAPTMLDKNNQTAALLHNSMAPNAVRVVIPSSHLRLSYTIRSCVSRTCG